MYGEVKELIFISVEIISVLNELGKVEDGKFVDYSDIMSDLKWNLHILKNRLNDIKRQKEI